MRHIAALYVETGGAYFGLEGVDAWDEQRDARLYDGPYPVVAHPPCNRWSKPLAFVNQTRFGHKVGDDGGCFAHALDCVRRFGGVLEHPAHSAAWDAFQLPRPSFGGWQSCLFADDGYVTAVDQWAYGHQCRKTTWLYCFGVDPPALKWHPAPTGLPRVSYQGAEWHRRTGLKLVIREEASRTPIEFRDVLIGMARSVLFHEVAA